MESVVDMIEKKKVRDLVVGDLFVFDKRLYLFEAFVDEDDYAYPVVKASMYINRHEFKSRFARLDGRYTSFFDDLVRYIYMTSDYEVVVMDFNFDIEFAYYLESHGGG